MRQRPYPPDIQLLAITRIRAGESHTAVCKALHVDDQVMRQNLRASYPDYDDLMQCRKKHVKPRIVDSDPMQPTTPQPWSRKGYMHLMTTQQKERRTREREQRNDVMRPRGLVRTMGDFSEAALAELLVKIEGYIQTGVCRVTSDKGISAVVE